MSTRGGIATSSGCRRRDGRWGESPRQGPSGRIVVAVGVALTAIAGVAGCASDDSAGALAGDEYVAAMSDVCTTTDERLADLPQPPEQISAPDWAGEVARAWRAEQAAADAMVVDAAVRADHATFTTTTGDLADRYDDLADALRADDGVTAATDEITELSLGRDDVAGTLGLDACVRSSS